MISIISDDKVTYPDASDFFSPHIAYPEYSLEHLSRKPNLVYDAVRKVFAQAGLDHSHYGTANWNPLGEFVVPGSRVFVLCNFVYQRRPNESVRNFSAKCTHGSVLRAAIDYILRAVGPRGKVTFGNAPLQSCNWQAVLRDTGADRVAQFYKERGFAVVAPDLRMFIAERNRSGTIGRVEDIDKGQGVDIDLGSKSLLSQIDRSGVRYRVIDYDPRQTESYQRLNKHVYVINPDILDANVIFSIPKLKTHEKVGITCAIKGCVGIVGSKDSLAHHRFGPPSSGGDEYPTDRFGLKGLLSCFHEAVQKMPIQKRAGRWARFIERLLRFAFRKCSIGSGGAWWGNDTCWRMAVDLARILAYAAPNGALQKVPARSHLALVDGIIGGEGQGPLSPTAVKSGALIFGDNAVAADYAAAIMMGYDPHSLPIVWNATKIEQYPLLTRLLIDERIVCNGARTSFEKQAREVLYHYTPPRGWKGRL